MMIFMSFYTCGKTYKLSYINMWKLSVALVKKHYDNVNLITDSIGYEMLKSVPFDNVFVELDNIPKYSSLYSLGKIYAYKFISSFQEPFLHLDADVFLWEKLPQTLTESDIFCQSDDGYIGSDNYNLKKLNTTYNIPNLWTDNIGIQCYDLAILGGTNYNILSEYADFCINMINDQSNTSIWNSDYLFLNKSILVEQGNFGIFCAKNNILPSIYFPKNDPSNMTYKKYTHLATDKTKKNIIEGINNRISTNPYNLTPKDVSIDEWN